MIQSDPGMRLKPTPYARPDYFTTDVERGVTVTPNKTRIVALTNDFLLGFRDAVIYEAGKSYRRVLEQCGRRWGTQFMRRFDAEVSAYYQTPFHELHASVVHACVIDAFNYHGWGLLDIRLEHLEQGVIVAELTHSMMPEVVRQSDRPVDMLMCGLLASVFSHLANQALEAIQTDCPTMGAETSRFVIAATRRISEVKTWLNSQTNAHHDAVLAQLLGGSAAVEVGTNGHAH